MTRRLVAALACRNEGTRLYGKPLQNLNVQNQIKIIDNVVGCLQSIQSIDEVVLGISEGVDNESFRIYAEKNDLRYVIGHPKDVLSRLIKCGDLGSATDVFRVTSESPFLYFDEVDSLWDSHQQKGLDATFMDSIIDGCGFEIISLDGLKRSHIEGSDKHRSELCTLFIRENLQSFNVERIEPPAELQRFDVRLTVDNPEDLIVCRAVYNAFCNFAPRIPVRDVIKFLDQNPGLIRLTEKFTESGYQTMYTWNDSNQT